MITTNSTLTTPRLTMFLIALAMVSCDSFSEDEISPQNQLTFGDKRFYTLPGTALFIDASKLIEESFVNATMTISTPPSKGAMSELDNTLLKYQPTTDFIIGADEFIVSVRVDGQNRHNETIHIIMKSKVEEFPCGLYAIGDSAVAVAGLPLGIPVLENDGLCGVGSSAPEVSVYAAPSHGNASVDENIITYTPGPTFDGSDELIYKLSAWSGDSVSYAAVKISQCGVTALADTIRLHDGKSVNILNNDGLCDIRRNGLKVSIFSGPRFGTASLVGDSVIVYDAGPEFPGRDKLTYQLSTGVDGDLVLATVQIVEDWTIESFDAPRGTDLYFVDEMTGFINGIGGGVFKTTNGGETWTFILSTEGWNSDIQFLDTQLGYATYFVCPSLDPDAFTCDKWFGSVLKTSNGGESWEFLDLGTEALSLSFTSATTGYVSALVDRELPTQKAILYKTEDGGEHWTEVFSKATSHSDPGFGRYEVTFVNSNLGYFWGPGQIYITENAGEAWTDATGNGGYTGSLAVTQNFAFSSLVATTGWGVEPSSIAISTHGGDWQIKQNFPFKILKVGFSASGNLGVTAAQSEQDVLSGNPSIYSVTITRTVDEGETWVVQPAEEPIGYFVDVSVPSDRVAYILGEEKIIRYSRP